MHEQHWIYKGANKAHLVQMFHFTNSGRLIIRLNGDSLYSSIFLADLPDNKLQFFIDGDLCELSISQANQKFYYQLDAQHDPSRLLPQGHKDKARLREIGIGAGMAAILLCLILPLAYFVFTNFYNQHNLLLGGLTSEAIITHVGVSKSATYASAGKTFDLEGNTHYKFLINDKWYYGNINVQQNLSGMFTTIDGLPIVPDSKFEVLFIPNNPNVNKILFDRPSSSQVEAYRDMAVRGCLTAKPKKVPDDVVLLDYCDCFIDKIYEKYSLEGLAKIAFQNVAPVYNNRHNQRSYSVFVGHPEVRPLNKACQESAKH